MRDNVAYVVADVARPAASTWMALESATGERSRVEILVARAFIARSELPTPKGCYFCPSAS